MKKNIPLSTPYFFGNEKKYVNECIDTEWVSTAGKYVENFEHKIQKYTKSKYAIACTSGTSALHIALILSGAKINTEVIVSTMTFIAPINAISYCSSKPIFMDVDDDYGIDIKKTISFIENETVFKNNVTYNKKSGKIIPALIVVHIYGRSVFFEELESVCKKRNILIIEDAAEGLGNFYLTGKNKNKHVGTIGSFGCLSFNGNKVITSGGGGMILTNNKKLALKAKSLTTQAKKDPVFFIHDDIGYNYRLTNIQAALGIAQLKQLDKFVKIKRKIGNKYKSQLRNINHVLQPLKKLKYCENIYWVYGLVIKKESKLKLDEIRKQLFKKGIETRNFFWPLNKQPILKKMGYFKNQKFPVAEFLGKNGFYIPTGLALTEKQQNYVIRNIKNVLKNE